MIAFIKSWCEGIIVAVMLSIIIELMIPEGSNKKYVKVVIGIYILFVIIGPILEKIKTGYELEKNFDFGTVEVSTNVNSNIKDVYVAGIEETIKKELLEFGYFAKSVNVVVDNNYENIEKIEVELTLKKENQNGIQIELIMISKKELEEKNNNIEIKKILSESYKVPIDKIYIFES